jgi:tRNA pseudouridine38-40 synthase
MPRLKITVEYDGSAFSGWQSQSGGGAVQDEIERAIKKVTAEKIRIDGSGRTDSGVHAWGQVATFDTESDIPPGRFPAALNANLPPGIAVIACEEVDAGFHARISAKSKTYRYVIANRPVRPAIDRDRAAWIPEPLDAAAMHEAAQHLVGSHDFRAFASEPDKDQNCHRTILRCDVAREGERISITVEGSGFLKRMVRAIAGTLIEVGRGKYAPERVGRVLRSRDRSIAGPTAPPQGLYLVEVKY